MLANMQSRLVGASRRVGIWGWISKRGMSSEEESAASQGIAPTQGQAPLPTGRSADPAVHATEPLGADADAASIAAAAAAAATKPPARTQSDESEALHPPKPPHSSSPKLEHTEVGLPSKPNTQQRRPYSNQPAQQQQQQQSDPLANIFCAGLDVSPWPDDAEGQKAQKKAQEEDNKEYFKDHKASPLSEIEFADSRKPISQATDNADDTTPGSYYGGGEEMPGWRPEQEESAEETMLRGAELWQWRKMRGDPNSPHGRVLRALRGEFF